MAFTYDLANADPNIVLISRVRLALGDHVEGTGVMPNGDNFQDNEIALYLVDANDDVEAATMALAGVLANHWTTMADVSVGPRREAYSKVAGAWANRSGTGTDGGSTLTSMRAFFGVARRGIGYP